MEQISDTASDDQITSPMNLSESNEEADYGHEPQEYDACAGLEELMNERNFVDEPNKDDNAGSEEPLDKLEFDHEPNEDGDTGMEEPINEDEYDDEPYEDDSMGWDEPLNEPEYEPEPYVSNVQRWDDPMYEPYDVPKSFNQDYLCLPISHIDKNHLEDGNKIIMPASALGRLMELEIEYPMLFQIKNHYSDPVSHCGVIEFSSEEGFILLPNWMMKNMEILEGDLVNVRNVRLPKGQYMKIQPHETKFVMDIKNPKDVLEVALKDYTCVTVGDTIIIPYEGQKYCVDIVEAKPSNAISLIETDCEVDFATPLDYKEPEKKKACTFTGVGGRLNQENKRNNNENEGLEPQGNKFQPFTGKKYTF